MVLLLHCLYRYIDENETLHRLLIRTAGRKWYKQTACIHLSSQARCNLKFGMPLWNVRPPCHLPSFVQRGPLHFTPLSSLYLDYYNAPFPCLFLDSFYLFVFLIWYKMTFRKERRACVFIYDAHWFTLNHIVLAWKAVPVSAGRAEYRRYIK